MTHVYMLFFKHKSFQNGSSMIQGDQDGFWHPQRPFQAHGEYSEYQLCPPKIDMAHVYILIFKDKSI